MKIFGYSLFILMIFVGFNTQAFQAFNVDGVLSKLHSSERFNGVVGVATPDKMLFNKAYGYENKENNTLLTTSSRFYIASPSKIFTAVLILKLIEEGKINLDDKLGQYFPFLRKEMKENITIHHLLSHQSGLPEFYEGLGENFDSESFFAKHWSIGEIIAYLQRDLLFEPGQGFKYSDSNYVYLSAIIEQVSKHSLEEELRIKIFSPLKMSNSGYFHGPEDNVATLYQSIGDEYEKAQYISRDIASGASAIYSTLDDLVKFSKALYLGDLLEEESKQLMLKKYSKDDGNYYGYGTMIVKHWSSDGTKFHEYYGHKGGPSVGVNTLLAVNPKSKNITIILSNLNTIKTEDIYFEIQEALELSVQQDN